MTVTKSCSVLFAVASACAAASIAASGLVQSGSQPDWKAIEDETTRHYQAVLRLDTSNPPGNETQVAEYVKQVLDKEGIPAKIVALDPKRANVVARLKGNGTKRPVILLAHMDVVKSKKTRRRTSTAEDWVYEAEMKDTIEEDVGAVLQVLRTWRLRR